MEKSKHRKVADILIEPKKQMFIQEIVSGIESIQWPYKTETLKPILVARDQALAALITLIGPRVSESLRFQRKDFTELDDRVLVGSFQPGKKGELRQDHWLPKKGPLAPLTEIFMRWLNTVPNKPEAFVFPSARFGILSWDRHIGRKRAHWIFKTTINRFPHWYRGVCESFMGRVVFRNDPYRLRKFMGVKRLESVIPYVAATYEADLEEFNKD